MVSAPRSVRCVRSRPNVLWALDFQFDTTVDGRTLKLLNIVDEFTRECPAIVVGRHCDADKVVATLDAIAMTRGAPAFVRFDNGPEFIARAVADWCRFNGVGTVFIDPGSPWQNAWIESFNGRLRDELLNGWHFDNLLEAQVLIEDWRIDYNDQPTPQRPRRPHPKRVRPSMDQPKPTSTRITAGPLNGDPSVEPTTTEPVTTTTSDGFVPETPTPPATWDRGVAEDGGLMQARLLVER